MSKIFEIDFRKGTLIDSVQNIKGTNDNDFPITKSDRGYGLKCSAESLVPVVHDVDLDIGTGEFSFVTAIKINRFVNHGSTLNYFAAYTSSTIFTNGIGVGTSNGTDIRVTVNNSNTIIKTVNVSGYAALVIITRDSNGLVEGYVNNGLSLNTISVTSNIDNGNFISGSEGNTVRTFDGVNYYNQVYNHALTQTERNKLYSEFLNSYSPVETKTNFELIKPTDLSYLVDDTLGDELITNGTFSTGDLTGWTLGGSITTWTYDSTTGSAKGAGLDSEGFNTIYQNILTIGKKYILIFDYNVVSGELQCNWGTGSGSITGTGKYINYITPSQTNLQFGRFFTGGSYEFYIDNVTIKEVTGLVAAYNMVPSAGGV